MSIYNIDHIYDELKEINRKIGQLDTRLESINNTLQWLLTIIVVIFICIFIKF